MNIALIVFFQGSHPYGSLPGGKGSRVSALKSFTPIQIPEIVNYPGAR